MALDYIVAEGHDGRVTSPLRLCHTDTAPAGHLLGALQHQLAASVERVMELGAVDYITKPFAVDYLEETVDAKIARYLIYVKARRLNGAAAFCTASSISSGNSVVATSTEPELQPVVVMTRFLEPALYKREPQDVRFS